jgi:hypothetical protein
MKITKKQLEQIIKEETKKTLAEAAAAANKEKKLK